MKNFFKKIWNWISFPSAFILFMMRLTIRSFGAIDEDEDEED